MNQRQPKTTRTATHFPYATLFLSDRKAETAVEKLRDGLEAENTTLRQLVADLVTPVLERGILGRSDALFVLGFPPRSEEHTSELQSLMRISSAVFCLTKKKYPSTTGHHA